MNDIYGILREQFGFSAFRGVQQEVIQGVLAGQDALVIMPTGMGKSLCYQLPSVALPGLTLVISPLIALMKDQVDAGRKKGLRATFINSSLKSQERERRHKRLAAGEYDLLYVTPERFRKAEFWKALKPNQLALLAVDEAHCISQWGHDFRPDYSRLEEIRTKLQSSQEASFPTLALTATATPAVQTDILKQLGITETAKIYTDGVQRPNLHLRVEDVVGDDEKVRALVGLRHSNPGPGIVYFSLISTLEKIMAQVQKLGLKPLSYHGQLSSEKRHWVQKQFLEQDSPLIFATPAFGLGVDRSNVRLLVHGEMPGAIEAYYQEVGRAGRDGLDSECVLLLDEDDVSIQMDFLKWANPDPGFIRQVYQLIANNIDRVAMEGLDYLREQLNFYNRRDFRVETSINLLERWGSIERSEKRPTHIRCLQPPPEEYLDAQAYEQRLRSQNTKLLEMLQFAKDTKTCRLLSIYRYFGLSSESSCGHCDNCLRGRV